MTNIKSMFHSLDEAAQQTVRLCDNDEIKVAGIGTVTIRLNSRKITELKQVQYVPHLAHNLLSVGQLLCSSCTITFTDQECIIRDKRHSPVLCEND